MGNIWSKKERIEMLENKVTCLVSKLNEQRANISDLYEKFDAVNKKLARLECPHYNVIFRTFEEREGDLRPARMSQEYFKICEDCNKTLQSYDNQEEWERAKIDYYEQKTQEIRNNLKDKPARRPE